MSTLEAFFKAGKDIVSVGAQVNAQNRQKIRDVVGQVADELDRALMLANSYLAGIQYSGDDQEMMQYLGNAYSKLRENFSEHHVCAGLYHLGDQFKQLFNSLKLSVSIGSENHIEELILRLQDGERAVIDDLDAVIQSLSILAMQLNSAAPNDRAVVRQGITRQVALHQANLGKLQSKIKSLRREIIDTM